MEETKKLHPLLGAFKERMKIFHDAEDENLSRMLASSEQAILDLQDISIMIKLNFSLRIFKEKSLNYR